MKNMESATGARRCKISHPFFCARRVQFWLHFEVRGGHWLDEGRLLVQKRNPKAIPKSELHTERSSKWCQNGYRNRRFFNLDCKRRKSPKLLYLQWKTWFQASRNQPKIIEHICQIYVSKKHSKKYGQSSKTVPERTPNSASKPPSV